MHYIISWCSMLSLGILPLCVLSLFYICRTLDKVTICPPCGCVSDIIAMQAPDPLQLHLHPQSGFSNPPFSTNSMIFLCWNSCCFLDCLCTGLLLLKSTCFFKFLSYFSLPCHFLTATLNFSFLCLTCFNKHYCSYCIRIRH